MAKDWQGTHNTRFPLGRWVAIAAIVSIVAAAYPLNDHPLTQLASFYPSVLTITTVGSLLAAFLLFQAVLSGRDARLAGIGSAFLFSALSVIPQAMSTPGIWTKDGVQVFIAARPEFWTVAHVGFAIMILASFAFGRTLQRHSVTGEGRRGLIAVGVIVPIAMELLALTFVTFLFGANNGVATPGAVATPIFIFTLALTLAAAYASTKNNLDTKTIENVLPVSLIATAGSLILTNSAVHLYSTGWYVSRLFNVFAVVVVLMALLVSISQLYGQAERDKSALEDEALHLLKESRAAKVREDRVRRIIENAADAYVEVDRRGIVRNWNSKATEMFGWRGSEAIGLEFVALVMADEGQPQLIEFIDAFWADAERQEGARAEIIAMNRNTVEFPVEVTVWVDETENQPQMNFFLRDITTRRQADEQLQRALEDERQLVSRLKELDLAKNDFVSSVSHELRSPLTSTLGFLELLAEGDGGELNAEQLRMIDIASRNARRLFVMIEDLLTLSKIEENAFRVSYKPVRMESLVETIVHHNRMIANETGVALNMNMQGPLGVAPGDEQQLARAIDNIVGNAVKFTPTGGHVNVEVRRERDEVVIEVTDTGIGIPIEEQQHLFNRFFRASVAVEAQHQGTGLGLTIAKAIIDHHNGSINVESKLGRGTKVTVRCPALPVDETIDLASF